MPKTKPLEHPTFHGQWILIGDEVLIGNLKGDRKPAVVVGLTAFYDSPRVHVRFDRKPGGESQTQIVYLDQNQASNPLQDQWIIAH